jgi:hypothetical protein
VGQKGCSFKGSVKRAYRGRVGNGADVQRYKHRTKWAPLTHPNVAKQNVRDGHPVATTRDGNVDARGQNNRLPRLESDGERTVSA